MKKIVYIIVLLIGFIGNSQTPFPTGIRLPNATKSDTLSTQTRLPIMRANSGNLINGYVPVDSLSAYLDLDKMVETANSKILTAAERAFIGTALQTETDPIYNAWDKDYNDLINKPTIPSAPTGLEAIDEGNGVGYRIIGRNPANYGNIGLEAIDFSTSLTASTTFGARGYGSVAFGEDNIASGVYSFVAGALNSATGYASSAFGYGNNVNDHYSFSSGALNTISNRFSTALGVGLLAKDYGTVVVGRNNTDYTAGTGIPDGSNRLFIIGNGELTAGTPISLGAKSDAFVAYLSGALTAPSLTEALIEADTTGRVLTTKEFVLGKIAEGGGGSGDMLLAAPQTVTGLKTFVDKIDIFGDGAFASTGGVELDGDNGIMSVGDINNQDILLRLKGFSGSSRIDLSDGDIYFTGSLLAANTAELSLGKYGDGIVTGTATYGAAFDVNGKLIEVALGGGGGTDDQTATEVPFIPYSTIASTNVQDAIQEVVDEIPTSIAAANTTVSPSIAGETDAYAVMQANRTSIDSIQANMGGGINTTPRHVTSTTGAFTEAYNETQPNARLNVTENTNISITGMNAGDAVIFSAEETAGTERLLQFVGTTDTLRAYLKDELAYFVALKDTVQGVVWQRSYVDGKTDKVRSITGTGVTEIDWSITPYYDFTHGAMNDTLVFVAPKSSKPLRLKRTQDATGSRTLAYASDILVSGGTLPTLTTTANATDVINLFYNKESDKYTINDVELNLQTVTGTPPSGGTPVSYDVDAEAFMIATGIPDDATVYHASTPQEITGHELWVAIDTRIKGFKFYNLWTKIYGDYPFIGGTATTHKWNSKDPRDLDAAFRLTFSGTWTHNGVGITGNGTNTYANTHFTKNDGWTQSNIGYSFYNRSSLLETKFDFGALTVGAETNRISIITSRSTTAQMNSYMFNNSADGSVNVSTPTILGLISVNQSGLSHKVFTNAVQQGTTNTGNVQAFFSSLTSNPMFFGGANLNNAVNLPSSRNYSHLGITDAFTDTEIANYNTVIQAFETALGREM